VVDLIKQLGYSNYLVSNWCNYIGVEKELSLVFPEHDENMIWLFYATRLTKD